MGTRGESKSRNEYAPYTAKILHVNRETPDISSFQVAFEDQGVAETFNFKPGNFITVSIFGYGEAPFAISSPPSQKNSIEFSVRRLGKVTQALHEMTVGDRVGVRGPYGNNFYLRDHRGRDLVFVAGGSGVASVRSMILDVLDKRESYGDITILFGARTVADIPYVDDFQMWSKVEGVNVILTVDPGGETPDWKGMVGYVPTILKQLDPPSENSSAFICGPPIMIELSAQILSGWGLEDKNIITTLENRMKCGIGKCGRCNIGHIYVCKHGPVFTYEEIKRMPMSDR